MERLRVQFDTHAVVAQAVADRATMRDIHANAQDGAMALFIVQIAHDPEAGVWFVDKSDVDGLSGEAPTSDALIARIPAMVADLLEENEPGLGDVAIEIIAHAHARISIPAAA